MAHEIVRNEPLNYQDYLVAIRAPEVAAKIKPGQFVVMMLHDKGERIPMSVRTTEGDAIVMYIRKVGKTTHQLIDTPVGGTIKHVIGPQGQPLNIQKHGTVVVATDSVCGHAWSYSVAKALKEAGNYVIDIQCFADEKEVYPEWALNKDVCDEHHLMTKDGSVGEKGHFNNLIKQWLSEGRQIDFVYAGGELIKLKQLARITRKYNVPTWVEAHQLMIDASGMCGACRVFVGGEMKLTCIDGPFFDAHALDFDSMINRYSTYVSEEKIALERYLAQKRGE